MRSGSRTCSEAARVDGVELDVRHVADGVVTGEHAASTAGYIAMLHAHERLTHVDCAFARIQRNRYAAVAKVDEAEVECEHTHAVAPVVRIMHIGSCDIRHTSHITPHKSHVTRHTSSMAHYLQSIVSNSMLLPPPTATKMAVLHLSGE
jgi:hypothetical protein